MGNDLQKLIPLIETMSLVLLTMLEEKYGYKVSQEAEEITNERIIFVQGLNMGP